MRLPPGPIRLETIEWLIPFLEELREKIRSESAPVAAFGARGGRVGGEVDVEPYLNMALYAQINSGPDSMGLYSATQVLSDSIGFNGWTNWCGGTGDSFTLSCFEGNDRRPAIGDVVQVRRGSPDATLLEFAYSFDGGHPTWVVKTASGVTGRSGDTPGVGSGTFGSFNGTILVAGSDVLTIHNPHVGDVPAGSWLEVVLEPYSNEWFAIGSSTAGVGTDTFTTIYLNSCTITSNGVTRWVGDYVIVELPWEQCAPLYWCKGSETFSSDRVDDSFTTTSPFIRLTANAPGLSIRSINPPSPPGPDGWLALVENVGSETYSITNEDGAGSASLRVLTPTSATLNVPPRFSTWFQYDGTSGRIRVLETFNLEVQQGSSTPLFMGTNRLRAGTGLTISQPSAGVVELAASASSLTVQDLSSSPSYSNITLIDINQSGLLLLTQNLSGEVELAADNACGSGTGGFWILSSTNGTYEDISDERIVLPSAGTYLITYTVRGRLEVSLGVPAQIIAKLRDLTNSVDLIYSDLLVVEAGIIGTEAQASGTIAVLYKVAASATIGLFAARDGGTTYTTSRLESDASGRTKLVWVRLGDDAIGGAGG